MDSVGPVETGDWRALPDFSRREQGNCKPESPDCDVKKTLSPLSPACRKTRLACPYVGPSRTRDGGGMHCRTCPAFAPVVYAGTCPQAAESPQFPKWPGSIFISYPILPAKRWK